MVRVADLHDQVEAGHRRPRAPTGSAPASRSTRSATASSGCARGCSDCFERDLRPGARRARDPRRLAASRGRRRARRARPAASSEQIFPALTPLVIGLGRPFPYISNLSLSLGVILRDPDQDTEVIARVKVPEGAAAGASSPLGDGTHLRAARGRDRRQPRRAVPGHGGVDHALFRVTRDTDYDVSDEADDLLQAVEEELRRRRFGEVVRLEVERGDERAAARAARRRAAASSERQVYEADGLLGLDDLFDIAAVAGFAELRYPAVLRRHPAAAPGRGRRGGRRDGARCGRATSSSTTPTTRSRPRSSASSRRRSHDPDVLAIKQTVYRTSPDSPLVPSLIEASERGKQAVCMVELKARFDEQANIHWAKKLEEAGVHVVYGIPALKTHVQVHPRGAPRGRQGPPLRPHRDRQLQPEDGAALHRRRPVHRRSRSSGPTSPRCSTT